MSKTIRCKNYELVNNNSWDRWGKKTALEFTTCQDNGWYEGDLVTWKCGYVCTPHIRYLETPVEMDKRDRYEAKRRMHGESRSAQSRTPGKWYRQTRMAQNRSINKNELNRWFQYGGEYEPCFESEPRSHYWDWS